MAYYKILNLSTGIHLQALLNNKDHWYGTIDRIFETNQEASEYLRMAILESLVGNLCDDIEDSYEALYRRYLIEEYTGAPLKSPVVNNIMQIEPITRDNFKNLSVQLGKVFRDTVI